MSETLAEIVFLVVILILCIADVWAHRVYVKEVRPESRVWYRFLAGGSILALYQHRRRKSSP